MKKILSFFIIFFSFFLLMSCDLSSLNLNIPKEETKEEEKEEDEEIEIGEKPLQEDFSKMTNREMEAATKYKMLYKPSDGFVGDPMPYYENGTFYIFFLKDQGNSFNHSIFLVETKDFINYEEKGEILKSSTDYNAQDNWIGTGSVCKVSNTYYFFYTGHNERLEMHERIMVATSENDLYHFKKLDGVYIDPTAELSNVDFRDPDVTYDKENDKFILTITTNAKNDGTVLVKYTVDKDLKNYTYDKIIFTDEEGFWNLECSDTFKIGNYWYLSYSGQDDTLWYAKSRSQYTGFGSTLYGRASRIESKFFYAAKSVSDGTNTYFVGWARRRGGLKDTSKASWAGNILVSKVVQREDGSIYLTKVDSLKKYYNYKLELEHDNISINDESLKLEKQYESFILEGDFKFDNNKEFGFVFGIGKALNELGHIAINPDEKLEYYVANHTKEESLLNIKLEKNKEYHFSLVFEGSVIVLYIDDVVSFTTRYYGKIDTGFGFYSKGNNLNAYNLQLRLRTN